MSETTRIAQLLKHSYDGQPWYGTPLRKLLGDVTAERAAAQPIAGAHSIWQEVRHVIGWRQFACRLLSGDEAAELTDAENWPIPAESDSGPAAWQQALDALAQTQDELQGAIARLTDEQLREKARGKPYNMYVLLHGILQHDAYHAGQIALLRNAGANS